MASLKAQAEADEAALKIKGDNDQDIEQNSNPFLNALKAQPKQVSNKNEIEKEAETLNKRKKTMY